MNNRNFPNGEATDQASKTNNSQLETPALTPISERGDDGVQPFPSYGPDECRTYLGTERLVVNEVAETQNANRGGGSAKKRRKSSSNANTPKASPQQIHDLVSSPDSLPLRAIPSIGEQFSKGDGAERLDVLSPGGHGGRTFTSSKTRDRSTASGSQISRNASDLPAISTTPGAATTPRPGKPTRSVSSPLFHRKQSSSRAPRHKPTISPLKLEQEDNMQNESTKSSKRTEPLPQLEPSPMPAVMPVPPLSLPTYLQLELSSERPSPLYLHRSASSDFPYESSKVKFERLLNFLLLPPNLEKVLWFGAIACLDAWLYTFTILPLRFLKAIAILIQWWVRNAIREIAGLGKFVYGGVGRVWRRRGQSSAAGSRRPSTAGVEPTQRKPAAPDVAAEVSARLNSHVQTPQDPGQKKKRLSSVFRHRRTKSTPSALLPSHKADILQGLLIILSCTMLMWFDASRMYHNIRGQSAIKLYVIYNVLEVFDRLFSALGQDILECLFSKETLERNENGRSKVIRPLWMFLLALAYNVIHSTALFYQVVTLNVAVNSYSNALLTLLMSNQFVEIKGTVFKKFEKENLFQLTCADVVERFQLWLMLLIIALRNIVEVGGLTISLNSAFSGSSATEGLAANATGMPLTGGFVIPKAFTLMPKWTGEVLGPFLIVLGSEALVDWCKHAYITKFNNVKPQIYGRFLDVLTKDYYSHAFADQNLTKRLGLPVIPLSCLFIRACTQTYHMLLATHMPMPQPSPATSVAVDSETVTTSPATRAALQHIDQVFRRAIGRSSFGAGGEPGTAFTWWNIDDIIALATMVIFFLVLYLILLICKLVLGMALLSYARSRYRGMKERERQEFNTDGRRVGGWGVVEVNEDKRRHIYQDDPDGLRELREKEDRGRKTRNNADKLDSVDRYMMAAKRIW